MTESILNSVKKVLGLTADNTEFDTDILMYINSTFATLHQIGIGPIQGYMIESAEDTWYDFLQGDNRLNSVKTYVALKVRSVFDPPNTSFAIAAMKDQMTELEWRLNVVRENVVYGAPLYNDGGSGLPTDGILDGGSPSGSTSIQYDGGTP